MEEYVRNFVAREHTFDGNFLKESIFAVRTVVSEAEFTILLFNERTAMASILCVFIQRASEVKKHL